MLENMKALVIDDNMVNVLIIESMLTLLGITVDGADSGKKAVELVETVAYDIIFIDHIMPYMDGVETIYAIRSNNKNQEYPVIIALTSNPTDIIINKFKVAGANDIHTKPLELKEIDEIIRKWFPNKIISNYENKKDEDNIERDKYLVKMILSEINEIDYNLGMKYALGNATHYMHLIKMSIKDIVKNRNHIRYLKNWSEAKEFHICVHSLMNVFANIGAQQLSEESRAIETAIIKGDINTIFERSFHYYLRIDDIISKLIEAVTKYDNLRYSESYKSDMEQKSMTKYEYEQSIFNTIYYIRRFEYASVRNEIEKLIQNDNTELKNEFLKALEEIEEFNYEKALERILKIQEKN